MDQTLTQIEEEALDLLHEVIQHTPLKIEETNGGEYDKGYIHYQDMVVETVKELEPKLKALLTSHSTELLRKIEAMKKDVEPLENLEGIKLNDAGIKRFVLVSCDHRQNAVLDEVISLINQEK